MIIDQLKIGDRIINIENKVVGYLRADKYDKYFADGDHVYAGYWRTPSFSIDEIIRLWVRY